MIEQIKHDAKHPLGCHRPWIGDRVIFNKLIQVRVLVLGASANRSTND